DIRRVVDLGIHATAEAALRGPDGIAGACGVRDLELARIAGLAGAIDADAAADALAPDAIAVRYIVASVDACVAGRQSDALNAVRVRAGAVDADACRAGAGHAGTVVVIAVDCGVLRQGDAAAATTGAEDRAAGAGRGHLHGVRRAGGVGGVERACLRRARHRDVESRRGGGGVRAVEAAGAAG